MAADALRQRLADLHAERVRTWDPAVLQVTIDQRLHLVGTSNYDAFVKPGGGPADQPGRRCGD